MPVQRIIFPNYDPSRPTNLASIDKAEALRVILAECMAIPTMLDHLGVAEFVRWMRDVECYQLMRQPDDCAHISRLSSVRRAEGRIVPVRLSAAQHHYDVLLDAVG